jgi:hypothetical protein
MDRNKHLVAAATVAAQAFAVLMKRYGRCPMEEWIVAEEALADLQVAVRLAADRLDLGDVPDA